LDFKSIYFAQMIVNQCHVEILMFCMENNEQLKHRRIGMGAYILRAIFVFAMSMIVQISISQVYFESNTIVRENITYDNLPFEGYGQKMFNILGIENNVNVKKIKLTTKSRLLLRISRNANKKLNVNISLTRVSIDGSVMLHDFNIDTLLWPSGFTAKLIIVDNRHKQYEFKITASATGIMYTFELGNQLNSVSDVLTANIVDIQFNYNRQKYSQLLGMSETIGYYYSYGILLNKLIGYFSKNEQNSDLSAESIFVNKMLVNRVVSNLEKHNFDIKLHLQGGDPIGFRKLFSKANRLSNRWKTLFEQQINSKKIKSVKCKAYQLLFSVLRFVVEVFK